MKSTHGANIIKAVFTGMTAFKETPMVLCLCMFQKVKQKLTLFFFKHSGLTKKFIWVFPKSLWKTRMSSLASLACHPSACGSLYGIYYAARARALSRVRLFPAPWTVARQAPLPVGFSKQEDWRISTSSSRRYPDPGIEPTSPVSSALAGGFFTTGVHLAPTNQLSHTPPAPVGPLFLSHLCRDESYSESELQIKNHLLGSTP